MKVHTYIHTYVHTYVRTYVHTCVPKIHAPLHMHVLLYTDMYVPVDMWATTNSALNMDGMSAQCGQDVVRTPPHDSCPA